MFLVFGEILRSDISKILGITGGIGLYIVNTI